MSQKLPLRLGTCALIIILGPIWGLADCILPLGLPGAIDFETSDATFMYCADSSWRKVCTDENSDTTLIGHWTFDGTGGTSAYDSSSYAHDGTWSGETAVTSVTGKIGNAYNFDGVDDYVNVTRTSTLEPSSAITVAAWVYWEGPANSNYGKVLSKTYGSVLSYGISQVGTTSTMQAELQTSSGFNYISLGTITTNQWVHVAMTWASGDKMKVFVDGVKISETSSNVSGTISYDSNNVRIGHNANGQANNQFDGAIDDVRLYSRALSESEIQRLVTHQSAPVPVSDPVAHWALDETGASTTAAASAGSLSGTMQAGLSGSDSVSAQVGTGLQFDGVDDYISFSADSSVNLTDVTLSFWVKPDTVTSAKNGLVILENRTSGSGLNYEIAIDGSGNGTSNDQKFRISYYNGTWYSIIANASAVAGTWQHVVFSIDSTNLTYKIFIDGVDQGSGAMPIALSTHSGSSLYLGKSKDSASNDLFDGALDDVRIYDFALKPHEVLNLYAENQELVCPQLTSCTATGMIEFDTTTSQFKFCDGANWRGLGGLQSVGSCTAVGQLFYEPLSYRIQFCDGTNLYEL